MIIVMVHDLLLELDHFNVKLGQFLPVWLVAQPVVRFRTVRRRLIPILRHRLTPTTAKPCLIAHPVKYCRTYCFRQLNFRPIARCMERSVSIALLVPPWDQSPIA